MTGDNSATQKFPTTDIHSEFCGVAYGDNCLIVDTLVGLVIDLERSLEKGELSLHVTHILFKQK